MRKLRTIRHPDVLKFLDAVETDTTVHVMTERVRPLCAALEEADSKSAEEREDWILWGLHRISVSTLNVEMNVIVMYSPGRADSIVFCERVVYINTWQRMY